MKKKIFSLLTAILLLAAPAMATTYYQNDFNGGNSGALSLDSKWQLLSSGGVGNSPAIRLTYDRAGTPGTQASLNLSAYNTQEFWLEFDTKIEGNMNGGMKFVKVFGSVNTHSQNNSTFGMDYSANTLSRVAYYMDTLCEVSLAGVNYNNSCNFTPVKTSGSIDLRGGQWHHVKIHFVRAAPGTNTGEYQIWIDGVEKVHFTNVNNNSPASSATSKIAAINFGDYTNSNNSTWYFWIDNLSVSSGDAGGSLPPTTEPPTTEPPTTEPPATGSGAFQWDAATYSVDEGVGTATFTIDRTDAESAASVDWGTFQNTAAVGQDYRGVAWQTVNFAAGESSKTVSVQLIDDSIAEESETFTLALDNAVNASLGTPMDATVTIADNESASAPTPPAAEPGTFQWSAPSYSGDEGSGTMSFTITRTGGSDGTASVDWEAIENTAAADLDFSGVALQTVTFADGETSKVVTVDIFEDNEAEGNETLTLTLSEPFNGSLGLPVDASVTIRDNDSSDTSGILAPPANLRRI